MNNDNFRKQEKKKKLERKDSPDLTKLIKSYPYLFYHENFPFFLTFDLYLFMSVHTLFIKYMKRNYPDD